MSVFVAVAEEQGFAAAARRMNMSPPSATRAVSDLEGRLGALLFHRTTRSVTLTEAGERYLADCRRILAEIEEADRHAIGTHAAPRGLVTVTGSVMFGRVVLTPILIKLQERYPDISLSALFLDRMVHLLNEGVDVAIRIAELPDSSLTAVRVGTVRRVLCASPDYLASNGKPETLNELSRHQTVNFIHEAPLGEWTFQEGQRSKAFRVQSSLWFNVADAAITAAIAGRGITRILSYMAAPHLRSGDLETVLDGFAPPAVPVHVVHKEPGETSARVRAVVDFLVEKLRKEPMLQQ
ncbi:MAG: LysR family transcriptional regulator [Pseudomonadota bacterium]